MEPLNVLDELENLKFSVACFANMMPPGSYEKELARNAVVGIKTRLEWCKERIAQERKEKK